MIKPFAVALNTKNIQNVPKGNAGIFKHEPLKRNTLKPFTVAITGRNESLAWIAEKPLPKSTELTFPLVKVTPLFGLKFSQAAGNKFADRTPCIAFIITL
jgi:hypothetical protein